MYLYVDGNREGELYSRFVGPLMQVVALDCATSNRRNDIVVASSPSRARAGACISHVHASRSDVVSLQH